MITYENFISKIREAEQNTCKRRNIDYTQYCGCINEDIEELTREYYDFIHQIILDHKILVKKFLGDNNDMTSRFIDYITTFKLNNILAELSAVGAILRSNCVLEFAEELGVKLE